jgi:uncharacterized membrane protein (UPF0127 family)
LLFATAAQAELPRQDPAHCKGQPVLKPLQPLTIVTAKGRTQFAVEYAANNLTREYGLMCRRSLQPDRGMLFDFKAPQEVAFWMRNTLIPLDIVFIGADGRVISVAHGAQPFDETPLPGGGPVRGVLEIGAGRAAQIGLLPGDKVLHRIFPQ